MSTDEKQAKEYAEKWQPTDGQAQRYIIQGYLAGSRSKEERITELKKRNGELAGQKASLERWLGEAKEIIKNIIRVTWEEGWSYSLDWKLKAEQFLKERD